MKNLIIFLLLSYLSFAQEAGESFIINKFSPGLPKELPFKRGNTSYVRIAFGNLYKGLFIVSRDSLKTLANCYSIINEKENYSVSPIVFSSDKKMSVFLI